MLGPKVYNPTSVIKFKESKNIMFKNKRTIKMRKNKTNKSSFCLTTTTHRYTFSQFTHQQE